MWEPGQKSGTWTFVGTSMLNNCDTNTINSQGAWEETGQHAWKCRGTGVSPDGHIVGVEFDGSLASGTWVGKLYMWN